jgi:nucleotide-binding universal stress UspA family protein
VSVALKKMLVPLDFSPGASSVLELASTFARAFGASIELFHVWQPPPLISAPITVLSADADGNAITLEELGRNAAATQLKEQLAALKKLAPVEAHCRVGIGNPAHEIVEAAAHGSFDLIIMGTHGRSGLAHALLGSVAEKVVRRAPCPVLTVRTGGGAARENNQP